MQNDPLRRALFFLRELQVDRFRPVPGEMKEALKPHLDYLASSALAHALRPDRRSRLLPVADFATETMACLAEMRRDPVLVHMLPLYLTLCRHSGLLDERQFRAAYESGGCAAILPQSNDLIGIVMVECAKMDYADSSGFAGFVKHPYFQQALLSPSRFAIFNPSNCYFLTHLIFGLTAWGNRPERVAGMDTLCDSLVEAARISLTHRYFDALAEAVIALAVIGQRSKVDRAWIRALASNVHELGYCADARYPNPEDQEEIGLFGMTYHCTLTTAVALDVFANGPSTQ